MDDPKNVQLKPIASGVIFEDILSHYISPDDSISYVENFQNDTVGTLTSRQPFVPVSGVVPSSPVTGYVVNNLVNQDKTLVYWKQVNRDLCQDTLITSGSQTTYGTFYNQSTIRDRFDVIQNTLLLTNYGSASAVYTHTGNTTTPAALDTKFPTSCNIISAGFVGRVWGTGETIASCNLYYSDVIPSAGILSLTTAAQQFLRINANNGDYITALVRTQEVLYVFTNNGIFRVFSTQSLDNASISSVGTPCQEAVVKTKAGIFFYHYSGIYQLNSGGAPQEISRVIYPLFERVPSSGHKNVFGWFDEDHAYWYLGELTGMTLNRYYIIRYTISTNVWTIYSTLTPLSYGYSCYLTEFGSTETAQTKNWYPLTVVFSSSKVATFNVDIPLALQTDFMGDFGTSGNESANVPLEMISKWYTFSLENKIKFIDGLSVASDGAAGFNIEFKLDKNSNPWLPIGKLSDSYVTLFRDWQSGYFNRIKFRVTGASYGQKISVGQFTALLLEDEGYANG